MNGKRITIKQYPHCVDCGYPLIPRPTEERDHCLVKPLVCLFCECEKDIVVLQVFERKPDDRFVPTSVGIASAGGAK